MFRKLLIANRGEIACRIIKTARRLGVATVAVYSDADAQALHVSLADEAHRIGPPTPAESYLDSAAILDAAKRAGADAIHPGYGFLSENAAFAQACASAGITFVGPPVEAIQSMGSKSESKRIMSEADVPLIPGYHGEDQSSTRLRAEAQTVGYPILLKASAGGGGRGMRVVKGADEFDAALEGAKREAKGAFGDDKMLIETYVTGPRHVEIQVFGDTHGNMVHLFERDCSAQRRHQKIIEEAPAPGLDNTLRERMYKVAIAAAKAIGYVGAGTVELLLDSTGRFFFMEMNTRLQVEHPVTELITGEDLVEWQLRVASGEPLPKQQSELRVQGHAVEARLYAENPRKNFMPSTGHLAHLRFPERDPLVRVDSGVRSGDDISFYYDPMIAKVIAWGESREDAVTRLAQALRATEVVGVTANAEFLAALVEHRVFVAGGIDTSFVVEYGPELIQPEKAPDDTALGLAALCVLLEHRENVQARAANTTDPHSPWAVSDSWRMNLLAQTTMEFTHGSDTFCVAVSSQHDGYTLSLPSGRTVTASAERLSPHRLQTTLDGVRREISALTQAPKMTLFVEGQRFELNIVDRASVSEDASLAGGSLNAPMPGKVIAVNVEAGKRVRRGTTVMVMEAMKMEHNIVAPADGVVAEIRFQIGDLVDEDAQLLVINAD
jgi:3-methylcrotonyl-CoA carboxylase alpha subunit